MKKKDDKPKKSESIPPGVSAFSLSVRLLKQCGRGEWGRVAAGLVLLLATSAAQVLQPWPLKLILDGLLDSRPLPGWVTGSARLFGGGQTAALTVLCAAILLVHVVAGLLSVVSTYFLVDAGLRMVFKLRCALFDHTQRLSLRYHETSTVGDSLYRVTWDTYCVQTIFNSGLVPAFGSAVTLAGIAVVMLGRDALVTGVALGLMVPLTLLVRRLEKPVTARSMAVHERESDVSSHVQETLSGIRAVQAFAREGVESRRFREGAGASLRAKLNLNVLETLFGSAVGLLLAVGTAAVVWVASYRVIQGRLTPGDVVLLVAYVAMLYKPLSSAARTAATLQGAAARAWRVCSVLDSEPEVRDRPDAVALPGRARGEVELRDVTFAYSPGRPVLRDVSLKIQAGSTVALVGASGAGKTTLAGMLLRFYDPAGGQVLLDGHDLRGLTLESLRRNVALVLQEPILFASSVRENIAYGRPDATDADVRAAAEAAGAAAFIEALPDGYDTRLGERGANLSGGQRQRLSIARAFVQDAPVLVMDEPTSALDARTEAALLATLARLKEGRTTIIVAHRLSTIRDADRIVVLDNGRVAEVGDHAELLSRHGLYASLHTTQFGDHGTHGKRRDGGELQEAGYAARV